ncbi:MAG: rhodanese-like domain-containing protein [Gemmataceae bacterium]
MPQKITPRELADRIASKLPVFLLDVRQPEEHAIARIEPSQLIPLGELVRHLEEIQPPPNAAVVVYCHHGVRSLSAAAILERAGLRDVFSLSGGIDAWSMEINPTVPRY